MTDTAIAIEPEATLRRLVREDVVADGGDAEEVSPSTDGGVAERREDRARRLPLHLDVSVRYVDPWPALRHQQDRDARDAPQFVVTRWLTLAPTHAIGTGFTDSQERRTFALGRVGRAVLDAFQPRPAEPNCSFATGRVIGSGLHVVRFARVVVELRRHESGHAELTIRPISRSLTRWGDRRQRRYYDLMHRLADVMSRDCGRGRFPLDWSVAAPAACLDN